MSRRIFVKAGPDWTMNGTYSYYRIHVVIIQVRDHSKQRPTWRLFCKRRNILRYVDVLLQEAARLSLAKICSVSIPSSWRLVMCETSRNGNYSLEIDGT